MKMVVVYGLNIFSSPLSIFVLKIEFKYCNMVKNKGFSAFVTLGYYRAQSNTKKIMKYIVCSIYQNVLVIECALY